MHEYAPTLLQRIMDKFSRLVPVLFDIESILIEGVDFHVDKFPFELIWDFGGGIKDMRDSDMI